MKSFSRVLTILALLVGITTVAQAQGSFVGGLLGGALGASLASDGQCQMIDGQVLYSMPQLGERVKDPLEMRTVAWNAGIPRRSLRAIFGEAIKWTDRNANPLHYEILQVIRRPSEELWFAYIEKTLVGPIPTDPPQRR